MLKKVTLTVTFALIALASAACAGASSDAPAKLTPIPSLEGTVADGALSIDEDGSLVLDAQTRLFFDYFLSARGEVADRVLVEHVRRAAQRSVSTDAANQAAGLFADHLRYADLASRRLDRQGEKKMSVADAFELLEETRLEVFGADVASQLFADQLALERSALLMQKAQLDAEDAGAQRAALARYEASLTPAERDARSAATLPLRIRQQVREMRLAGAGEDEIWAVRAEAFGAEAADRLRDLDRRRAER
ncbi:MAG: lipase secretion chaperone [Acidobacteriota bacterium]